MHTKELYTSIKSTMSRPSDKNFCSVVAFAIVFDTSFDKADAYLYSYGRKFRKGMLYYQIKDALEGVRKSEVIKLDIPRMNINKFVKLYPTGRYYITVRGHATCVVDGVIHDYGDMGRKFITHVWQVKLNSKIKQEK